MLKTVKEFIVLMKSQQRRLYLSLVLNFLDGFLVMVPLILTYFMVAHMPEVNPKAQSTLTAKEMHTYIFLLLGCIIVRIILRYLTMRLRSGAGYEAMCDERIRMGQHLRSVSLGYFTEKNLGDLVSTITSDAAFLEIEGLGVVEKVAVGLPALLVGLSFLLCLDYRIFLMTAVLFVPTWFAYKWLAGTQDRLHINRQQFISEVAEETMEFVRGIHVLKAFRIAEDHASHTKQKYAELRDFSIQAELTHIPHMGRFQFCFRSITVAIVFLSGCLFLQTELDFMSLFLLVFSSLTLFSGVELMGIYSIFSKMTQQSIDRVKQILNIPKMQDLSGKEILNRFDVSFDAVHFSYGSEPVLKGVSFHIPEKTTTALVGLSGSGKTTILNLLARFWEIKSGAISIGGKELRSISYEHLLQQLSFVFQEVFLFQDTIMNNLLIGNPNASQEEVVNAAKRAQCHDFIMALPDGYNTVIGEDGSTLSGGEKQRISIARALLKDAPIVLLDEVTANMDVENELLVSLALQELLKDKTVLMIAHKLSTIQDADQILVLENGAISQRGVHSELVAYDGLYRRLWDMQSEAELWSI